MQFYSQQITTEQLNQLPTGIQIVDHTTNSFITDLNELNDESVITVFTINKYDEYDEMDESDAIALVRRSLFKTV